MAPVARRPGEWPWNGRIASQVCDKADRNVGDTKRDSVNYREIRAAKHVSFRGVLSTVSAARTAEINTEDGGENRRNKYKSGGAIRRNK